MLKSMESNRFLLKKYKYVYLLLQICFILQFLRICILNTFLSIKILCSIDGGSHANSCLVAFAQYRTVAILNINGF